MEPQQPAAWAATATKLAPGVVGAIISLRWSNPGSSWADRLTAFAGGCGCAAWGSPALIEWVGVGSVRVEAFVGFAVGMLGMSIASEVVSTIRGLALAETIRNIIAARFGGSK